MPWFQHISGVTLLSFVVTLPTWPWPDLRSWSCWWRRPTSRREASTNAWTIASQACVWLRRGTKWDGLEAHFNIWGCIKTNLAIFGGMNIHLPVIWGSLGYQGFDSYPYIYICQYVWMEVANLSSRTGRHFFRFLSEDVEHLKHV